MSSEAVPSLLVPNLINRQIRTFSHTFQISVEQWEKRSDRVLEARMSTNLLVAREKWKTWKDVAYGFHLKGLLTPAKAECKHERKSALKKKCSFSQQSYVAGQILLQVWLWYSACSMRYTKHVWYLVLAETRRSALSVGLIIPKNQITLLLLPCVSSNKVTIHVNSSNVSGKMKANGAIGCSQDVYSSMHASRLRVRVLIRPGKSSIPPA